MNAPAYTPAHAPHSDTQGSQPLQPGPAIIVAQRCAGLQQVRG